MNWSTDYYSHRAALVVLLLLTAVVLEVLRRVFGYPRFGDVRGMLIAAGCALAIAAGLLLVPALLFHWGPFSG